MSPRAWRIGTMFGIFVSTWASVVAFSLTTESPAASLVWRVAVPLGAVAAWIAVWAWRTERWSFAAVGFLLSLTVPAGYGNILSGPIALGLAVAAIVLARRHHRIGPESSSA